MNVSDPKGRSANSLTNSAKWFDNGLSGNTPETAPIATPITARSTTGASLRRSATGWLSATTTRSAPKTARTRTMSSMGALTPRRPRPGTAQSTGNVGSARSACQPNPDGRPPAIVRGMPDCQTLGAQVKRSRQAYGHWRAKRRKAAAAGSCYCAHATHEDRSVICWKIEHFIRPIAARDGDSHRNATCSRISRCFAHATHEDSCVTDWKIMSLTPQERAKTAPFRPVRDDFRQVSMEIPYDRAPLPAAKADLRLRLSRLSSPCYATEQGAIAPCYLAQPPHEHFIASN